MFPVTRKWAIFMSFVEFLCRTPLTRSHDVKTWITDTNFLNPHNWENEQLPCANDRVIFPDSLPVITYMPQTFAVSELVLPLNGELIFPENSVFRLTGGTRKGACIGKDVLFKATVDYWFEPTNWNITSDSAFPRIPNRRNAAVPHAFQVPCPTDKVQFPAETTFTVHLDFPRTSVAAMDINDVPYSQTEFDDLMRSSVGPLLFPDNPAIHITSSYCTDETGCVCGNDGPGIFPTVCMFITPNCPDPECTDPITPVGSCCPICGSKIVVRYNEKFTLKQFLKLHEEFLKKAEFEKVESFTSKTHDGNIQSVLVDGGKNKGLASRAAKSIHDALVSDMKGADVYKIREAEIYTSEKWRAGVPTYDRQSSSGMSSGGVAALVIFFIVILGLGAAFYIHRKRRIPGFNFARFDLHSDKIDLELGTTPHEELQPMDVPVAGTSLEEKSKSFDNPVYGTAVEEVPPSISGESGDVKDFVENPMFTIFEDSSAASSEK